MPALLYVLPTFHNPTGRTLDLARAAGAGRRGRRARPDGVRGRPVRPAAHRGRGAAVAAASLLRDGRPRGSGDLRVVVLEERGAGAARGLPGAAGAPGRAARRRPSLARTCRRRCWRRRSCSCSSTPGYLEPHLADLAALPAAAPRRAAGRVRRAAGRRHLDAPGRRLLPVARAARAARRRRGQRPRGRRSASRSCRAPGSSPTTRADRARGWRSAIRPSTQIRTGAARLVELDPSSLEEPHHDVQRAVLRHRRPARPGPARARSSATASTRRRSSGPGGAKVAVQIVDQLRGGLGEDVRHGRRRERHPLRAAVQARRPARPGGRVDVRVRHARRHLAAVPHLRRAPASRSRSSPRRSRWSATSRSAKKLAARGDEAASHGFRWSNHFEMTRDEEREAIKRADRVDHAHRRHPAARLVLPRDERQHARAGGRGGRVRLRLGLLQRRPAVLVARARQAAPGGAVRPGRQRRALRARAGLLEPGRLLRDREGARSTGCATTATTCRG